ncbi:Lrp/AsnC family transcriptional regulator [uncultured Ferrovibrio sp.]|jgi:Lrp/AsnC family leucine-responsive transcriptional regulator|uniref:Lrp/AsnC family transcriptional regulator n=1 Tax=uncultured Ferrovibrio sp. TaxID=1576913 RepID=UPI0026098C69|nr:Lrp/AsnC family transcriptional regulator [uncultured Ferrovibrio sp.]
MPISDLDDFDRKILAALQEDGRLSNVNLAEKVGLSPSPCLRRVKRLEQEGYIRGYRAVLDRRKLGLDLTVYVEIKVEKHSAENAALHQKLLEEIPEVVAAHMVSGEPDFVAEVVVPDLASYERLLTERLLTLPMVKDIRSNFVLRQAKIDAPLPLAHLQR